MVVDVVVGDGVMVEAVVVGVVPGIVVDGVVTEPGTAVTGAVKSL